jgi:nucleoside-diphosphate-sugar epimerase
LVPAFEKFYSAIHVDDLVRGIADAGLAPGRALPSGERLFLTREQVFSYSEMMEAIGACLGKKPIAFPLPFPVLAGVAWGLDGLGKITGRTYPLNRDKLNEIRPDHWTCSGEKARKLLGFEAKHDIRSGWADAVAWYRSAGWI